MGLRAQVPAGRAEVRVYLGEGRAVRRSERREM